MSIWKLPYEALAASRSIVAENSGLRATPRFDVKKPEKIHLQFGGQCAEVCNVSVGGLAIYSDLLMPSGGQVNLTLNDVLSIQSEVVYCAPRGEWGLDNPPRHKMGLKLLSENDGYRVAMLALEDLAGTSGTDVYSAGGNLDHTL